MKKITRFLSVVLSAALLASVVTIAPLTVSAAEAEQDSSVAYSEEATGAIPGSPLVQDAEPPVAQAVEETAAAPKTQNSSKTVEPVGAPNDVTYEQKARYVPDYVLAGNSVKTMFNPRTMEMLLDMSQWAYNLQGDYNTWDSMVEDTYGYTQFANVVNNGVYKLGETTVEEQYYDENGNLRVRQVTQEHFFSAVNAGIALKELSFNGKTKYAVVVAFRGSHDFFDWVNDFRFIMNGDGVHSGFADNAADFYESTKSVYFNIDSTSVSLYDMIQDMKNPDSDYCMLVTGHSLGAALTEVFVGHYLYNDGIDPCNVAAYTFAAPRCSNTDRTRVNIFNFINDDDLVPKLGGYHIGTDFVYEPDNAFRQNYTSEFIKSAHIIDTSYRPITELLCAVDENGVAAIDSYTKYHTNGNIEMPGEITLNQDTYNSYSGNLSVLEGLTFQNASATVGGNCQIIHHLKMTNENDYLLVNGNLTTSLNYNGSDYLTAGTVEVKGNFAETSSTSHDHYEETGTHKTIFSGSAVQQISFANPSYNRFENPYFRNQHINFTTGIDVLRLAENTVIDRTEVLNATFLDLNGFSLTTPKDIEANGIHCGGGLLNCKNLTVNNEFTADGDISANGDLTVNNGLIISNARVTVGGNWPDHPSSKNDKRERLSAGQRQFDNES